PRPRARSAWEDSEKFLRRRPEEAGRPRPPGPHRGGAAAARRCAAARGGGRRGSARRDPRGPRAARLRRGPPLSLRRARRLTRHGLVWYAAGQGTVRTVPTEHSLESIARLLARRRALPESLLRRAQSESKSRAAFLGTVLSMGVPEPDLVAMVAEQLGIPGV